MFLKGKRSFLFIALLVLLMPLLAACGGEATATPGAGAGGTGAANPTDTVAASGGAAATPTTAAGGTGASDTTPTTSAGGSASSGLTGNSGGQITFWNGFTGPDRPAIEQIAKNWNDANPNAQVAMDILPWDSLMQKLLSTMSTGQGPDVVAIHFQYLPQYAKSGYIMDLSQYVQPGTELDPANWPSALVDLLKVDGKFYAAPMNYATLMLYYNKDMFKAAGLDPNKPPTNWQEWQDDAKKLTKADGSQYGLSIGEHDTIPNWPLFLWGNGGDVVKDGKSDIASPQSVEALKQWSTLVKDDKISPTGLSGAEADKLFQSGKAAMEVTGPWMTNGFTEAGLNYDVAPVPAGPAASVTLADTVILLVNKATKNPTAAVNFVKWWNTKDSQLIISTQTGFPPARTDLANDPQLAKNPWAPKFASVAKESRFYLPGLEKFNQIDTDVFVPMIQQIVLGKKSVEDATKEADTKITDLLK